MKVVLLFLAYAYAFAAVDVSVWTPMSIEEKNAFVLGYLAAVRPTVARTVTNLSVAFSVKDPQLSKYLDEKNSELSDVIATSILPKSVTLDQLVGEVDASYKRIKSGPSLDVELELYLAVLKSHGATEEKLDESRRRLAAAISPPNQLRLISIRLQDKDHGSIAFDNTSIVDVRMDTGKKFRVDFIVGALSQPQKAAWFERNKGERVDVYINDLLVASPIIIETPTGASLMCETGLEIGAMKRFIENLHQ